MKVRFEPSTVRRPTLPLPLRFELCSAFASTLRQPSEQGFIAQMSCLCLNATINDGILGEREDGDLMKKVLPKVMKLAFLENQKTINLLVGI
ncbi:uncharacterized protein LOC130802219 isoform X4 [Amaranthus tricolor]|uniref:uncharacterized protein LOC130802219 isoform X4 n=1 Tax=Amaranthus tricolor TaxID=29722 RepID=UPI0025891AFC|nr:uncharacterized protein LOC130802219 isoform X4 [Amaranthus tricolor]